MSLADMLHYAEKIDNYEADATSGTLWTSDTTFRVTCPSGKRWFVIGGVISRDVASTISGALFDSTGKRLYTVSVEASATADVNYPEYIYVQPLPLVMDSGDYIELVFNVAQTGAAFASCMVLEVDI